MPEDVIGATVAGAVPGGTFGYPVLIGGLDGTGHAQNVAVDSSGNLAVNATFTGTVQSGVAQGSTTSGEIGPLMQGAVTTASPTYTNGQTNPISLTPTGEIRVATIRLNGAAIDLGNGTTGSGTQRVTLASDSTGTVAVTQATAANLNAQVVGTAAAGAAASGNPVQAGGVYSSTPPTPATGQIEPLQLAENGQIITQPFGPTAKYNSATTTQTGTATAQLAANATSAVSIYITGISLSNTGSTASLVSLLPHSGSAVWSGINPAGGGNNPTLGTPIKITAATALDYTTSASSTTQYINVTYYLAAG